MVHIRALGRAAKRAGLREGDGLVSLGGIPVEDVLDCLYFDGEELGNFEAPDVTVPGKSVSDVHVDLTATLSRSFNIMQLMSMVSGMNPDKFTLDVSMKIRVKGGISRKIRIEDVPVESLFRKISYENI